MLQIFLNKENWKTGIDSLLFKSPLAVKIITLIMLYSVYTTVYVLRMPAVDQNSFSLVMAVLQFLVVILIICMISIRHKYTWKVGIAESVFAIFSLTTISFIFPGIDFDVSMQESLIKSGGPTLTKEKVSLFANFLFYATIISGIVFSLIQIYLWNRTRKYFEETPTK